jgi:hypothetical protein
MQRFFINRFSEIRRFTFGGHQFLKSVLGAVKRSIEGLIVAKDATSCEAFKHLFQNSAACFGVCWLRDHIGNRAIDCFPSKLSANARRELQKILFGQE